MLLFSARSVLHNHSSGVRCRPPGLLSPILFLPMSDEETHELLKSISRDYLGLSWHNVLLMSNQRLHIYKSWWINRYFETIHGYVLWLVFILSGGSCLCQLPLQDYMFLGYHIYIYIYMYCSRFLEIRPSASLLPQKREQSMRRNSRLLTKANVDLIRKAFALSWFVLLASASPAWRPGSLVIISTSTSQTFGLDIYIWCLLSRRRATNILAFLDETQNSVLLAHNICRSVSGDWTLLHHTATLIHGLKALPPTHLERPIYRRQCCLSFIYIYDREIGIRASINEQKRKQYCCRDIYLQHQTFLQVNAPTSATLCAGFGGLIYRRCKEMKKKKRERERTGQEQCLGRKILIPRTNFWQYLLDPHLSTKTDIAARRRCIRL